MRRLFTILAFTAMVLSCSDTMDDGANDLVGNTSVPITATIESADGFSSSWVSGSKLCTEGGIELPMTKYNESASIFGGDDLEVGTEYKIFCGETYKSASDRTYGFLYINAQDETLSNTPMMSESNITLSDNESVDPLVMRHLGAIMNLNVTFDSDMSGYKLTKVLLPAAPNTFVMSSTTSYDSPVISSSYLGVTVTLSEPIQAVGSHTIPFTIFPFTVSDGDSIGIHLYFEDESSVESQALFTSYNKSGSDWTFERANSYDFATFADADADEILCSVDDFSPFVGSGTKLDPYQISEASDLMKLSQLVSVSTTSTFSGEYFALTQNIPIDDTFTPIGAYSNSTSSRRYFGGIFDGCGYEVTGFDIDATSDYQALFAYINGATIMNLGVEGSIITTGNYAAGIATYAIGCDVVNCYNACDVESGGAYAGGIFGYVNSSNITNCYNEGDVIGGRYVGGIAANVNEGNIVTNCYNTGSVEGTSSSTGYVGGIAGFLNKADIINCYNAGSVTNKYERVGGIVGASNASDSTSEIINCYNVGDVSCTKEGGTTTIGGVIGYTAATITKCYYLVGSATIGSGSNDSSVSKTSDQMKALTSDLNDKAAAYNSSEKPDAEACQWVDGTGEYLYPTLNFEGEPSGE